MILVIIVPKIMIMCVVVKKITQIVVIVKQELHNVREDLKRPRMMHKEIST